MTGIIRSCPVPTEIPDIPLSDCPFILNQIVRFLYQQRQSVAPFADEAAMKVLANWTTLIAASDATKIVPGPLFASPLIPAGEIITDGGGDNNTFNGEEEIYGVAPVVMTGNLRNCPPETLAALDNLVQFSLPNQVGVPGLTVYAVNKDGVMFYWDVNQYGIPCKNHIFGTTGTEGLNKANVTPFRLQLPQMWDRHVKSVVPSFDPLTEI